MLKNSLMTMGCGLLFVSMLFTTYAKAEPLHDNMQEYCSSTGGVVKNLTIELATTHGFAKGLTKKFCTFKVNEGGYVVIGLETYASSTSNIAATWIKRLGEIQDDSPLFKGDAVNPSANVCRNIAGTTVGFIANGGFADDIGQSDICVFGDGSMVSAWSLIYMANGREGYDTIKNQVKSEPFDIYLPY